MIKRDKDKKREFISIIIFFIILTLGQTIPDTLDRFILKNHIPTWLSYIIGIVGFILLILVSIVIVNRYKVIPFFKNKISEKRTSYFTRNFQRKKLNLMAINLSKEGKYGEANIIFDNLLLESNRGDKVDHIYGNLGWNYIQLKDYDRALHYLREGIRLNHDSEFIGRGIETVYKIQYGNKNKKPIDKTTIHDKEHDFQLLHGPHSSLKDPNKLLQDLGFNNYTDLLYWLSDEFTKEGRQFGCGSCCRSLLPEFVTISEKESGKKFLEIIKENRNIYSTDKQEMVKLNYKHYFCSQAPLGKPVRTKMGNEFDNRINSKK